jgi:hypothetical protein
MDAVAAQGSKYRTTCVCCIAAISCAFEARPWDDDTPEFVEGARRRTTGGWLAAEDDMLVVVTAAARACTPFLVVRWAQAAFSHQFI